MKRKLFGMIAVLFLAMLMVFPSEAAQLEPVTDIIGILSESERQQLNEQAREISVKYDFGIYVVVVDSFSYYTRGSVQDAAETIYKKYSLGTGAEKDGIMLLLSMDDRDYSLITHGTNGNYTFNDGGRRYLTEYFLDDFANDDWYSGMEDYIFWCGEYLSAAKDNHPYSYDHQPMSASERMMAIGIDILIILLVPLAIAGIYIGILNAKMKSVMSETKANAYVSGKLNLSTKRDQFLHATETRTKISSDSGSSGGSRSRSGGSKGFSGTSGKF